MSWWTSDIVEPKRKSRFVVEIANGFYLPNVKTCSKPSANIDLKEFQLINHKFKYPGVVTWQDIKITMIDMNGNSGGNQSLDTGLLLWRMLKHTGYSLPTVAVAPISALGPNRQLSTTEKASSIANGFGRGLYGSDDRSNAGVNSPSSNAQSVRIYTLDPDGNTVETWTLHNPQIKSVNWGDHSYDSDEFVEYSLDISYDFAHLEKGKKLTVGPGLFDTPDMNTPISIGQKYHEFIAILQEGKAFTEARLRKKFEKDSAFGRNQNLEDSLLDEIYGSGDGGNLLFDSTTNLTSPGEYGFGQSSSPSYGVQGIPQNSFRTSMSSSLQLDSTKPKDPELLPKPIDYEFKAKYGAGVFGADFDPDAQ